jgi:hypothetical protein
MQRKGALWMLSILVFTLATGFISITCSNQKEHIPPGKIPGIPEACRNLSNIHTNALRGAYKRMNVSQLQLMRATNKFSECLQTTGLTEREANAILKNKVESFKRELDEVHEEKDQDIFLF